MIVVVLFAMVGAALAQNACEQYYWNNNDFPRTDEQDFESITYAPYMYLGHDDFNATGQYYGQTWKSVVESNLTYFRPLGYRWARLGPYNDPTVCLRVNGIQGYKIEFMLQSLTPRASLCVADTDTDTFATQDVATGANTCGEDKLYKCFLAKTVGDDASTTLKVAVWCDANCEDNTSIDFLYRFRRSLSRYTNEDENPEMWCMNIADTDDEWPDSLGEAIPNEYTNQNGNLFNSASTLTTVMAFGAAALVALLH